MATGPFQAYEKGQLAITQQTVDFDNDSLQAVLLDTAHTVDVATHQFLSDVVADECGDGDYSRLSITGAATSIVANKIRFDCDDIDFGDAVTISARYLLLIKNTGAAATSPLLFIADLNTGGGNLSSAAGDFDIAINANGIYEITHNV